MLWARVDVEKKEKGSSAMHKVVWTLNVSCVVKNRKANSATNKSRKIKAQMSVINEGG